MHYSRRNSARILPKLPRNHQNQFMILAQQELIPLTSIRFADIKSSSDCYLHADTNRESVQSSPQSTCSYEYVYTVPSCTAVHTKTRTKMGVETAYLYSYEYERGWIGGAFRMRSCSN
eukprot:scaffold244576_cov17-Prasinocladus_malaysianus.AAC.1